jgi:hypothetical protein
MYWLESMRRTHIQERGWRDIGQNITTFPTGKIAICRPINETPAGIYGANTGGICIEHFGNFDVGGDEMTDVHKDCIISVNAVLCEKLGLKPIPTQVVYHHWFDSSGKRFADSQVNSGYVLKHKLQKTCPGGNFFHDRADSFMGNTIDSAVKNFYPLIREAMNKSGANGNTTVTGEQKRVLADSLNVRSGKGTGYAVIRRLVKGAIVHVYETSDSWCRVSANSDEWVSAKYLA